MKYVMKSGTLSDCEKALIRVKGDFIGPGKKLYYADGTVALQTDIRKRETGHDKDGPYAAFVSGEGILLESGGQSELYTQRAVRKNCASYFAQRFIGWMGHRGG